MIINLLKARNFYLFEQLGAIKLRDKLKGFELNFARDLASVKCRMMIKLRLVEEHCYTCFSYKLFVFPI